jgi:alpha-D-xyloside xylohydrolase
VEPGDTVGDGPFDAITLLCFDPSPGTTTISDIDGDTAITASANGDGVSLAVDGPARIIAARPAFAHLATLPITLQR